jgi:pimeloyl-ACP methyl ester carboxylesterase
MLEERGAGSLDHLSGTLLAHLRRTAQRLESWGADPPLVAAGLSHAAYGTEGFPTALLRLEERALLRGLIGQEAEAIVYAYCALDRAAFVSAEGAELRDRFSGEHWTPTQRMQRQLAELTAANELDVVEHSQLSAAEVAALVARGAAQLSQAAAAACRTLLASVAVAPALDPELAYTDLGTQGERVLLWHGGGSPALTWSRQHSLSSGLRLRIPWRRGYPPSAPCELQDWEVDARDLLRVMPGRLHVVGHSIGALSALVAAAIAPQRFRSLIVIEPPLWIASHDPDVQQLAALSRAFLQGAPEARSAFLALAGLPTDHPETTRIELAAHRFRDPSEARPDLEALRRARVPTAVVSGMHARGIEIVCDALGEALDARRWRLSGAGHAVQRNPAFNAQLRELVMELAATEHAEAGG